MMQLEGFHFLRPLWLLGLPMAALLLWGLTRQRSQTEAWASVIAPHLLTPLLVDPDNAGQSLRPLHLLALFWVLGSLAMSGPAWQREPSPFVEDQAALVIVLKVTPSMLATDVQPSRLGRGVQKIHDLLERRPGAATALVAYSGSAHLVIPLTRDARIIEQFAAELSPEIMPVDGDAPAEAVALASRLLADSTLSGSILLMADSVAADQWVDLERQGGRSGANLQLFALAAGPEVIGASGDVSAPALDRDAMAQAARAAGGELTVVTVDDQDVDQINRRIKRSLARAPAGEGARWRDAGYVLLPLLVLLTLLAFRRGWVVGQDV